MKMLALTRYERSGASSRLRFYQYLPILNKSGFEITVSQLFSNAYVDALQAGRRKTSEVVAGYARRIVALLSSNAYDLIWVEKESLPWFPVTFERYSLSARTPLVLDYDDAVFHYYDSHDRPFVRWLLGHKHERLMRGAAMVIVGNDYLAEYAHKSGADRVEVLPTAVDLERYSAPLEVERAREQPSVGVVWIGQHSTAGFLQSLRTIFRDLPKRKPVRFAAIGIDAHSLDLEMESILWSEKTEVESIKRFDIGIMPLADGPFERGKCGYKLIQYMACSLPVVASPVGVNKKIVEHGVNGFLAETPEQWSNALEILINNEGLRRRMGEAGRAKVEREYCIQVTGPRLVQLLKCAAGG